MDKSKLLVLDTNVLIDLYKQQNKTYLSLAEYKHYTFCISHLVHVEFLAGIQVKYKEKAHKFLKLFKLLPYDAKAQAQTILLCSKVFLGRENKPIDLMIAGHVKSLRATLITSNSKDFIYSGIEVIPYKRSFW